jgi:hypothetical protein
MVCPWDMKIDHEELRNDPLLAVLVERGIPGTKRDAIRSQ